MENYKMENVDWENGTIAFKEGTDANGRKVFGYDIDTAATPVNDALRAIAEKLDEATFLYNYYTGSDFASRKKNFEMGKVKTSENTQAGYEAALQEISRNAKDCRLANLKNKVSDEVLLSKEQEALESLLKGIGINEENFKKIVSKRTTETKRKNQLSMLLDTVNDRRTRASRLTIVDTSEVVARIEKLVSSITIEITNIAA